MKTKKVRCYYHPTLLSHSLYSETTADVQAFFCHIKMTLHLCPATLIQSVVPAMFALIALWVVVITRETPISTTEIASIMLAVLFTAINSFE